MQKEHLYSEIFHSIQGEGFYTGYPTMWVRLWACNLQCSGFGQKEPTKPETYKLPYKDLDPSKFNRFLLGFLSNNHIDSSYNCDKHP